MIIQKAMNTKIHSVIHLNLINKKQGMFIVCFFLIYTTLHLLGFNNRLLSIAYESKQSEESNIEHLLWAFRPKITLENIMQMIETTNLRSSCPILYSFINQVVLFPTYIYDCWRTLGFEYYRKPTFVPLSTFRILCICSSTSMRDTHHRSNAKRLLEKQWDIFSKILVVGIHT